MLDAVCRDREKDVCGEEGEEGVCGRGVEGSGRGVRNDGMEQGSKRQVRS